MHRQAFLAAGLDDAWSRVVAIVVQPGVEFDHDSVVDYDSTDYQVPAAYRQLVEDGFAILKVGPALTFALREALDALSAIEQHLVPPESRSNLQATIDRIMIAHPESWAPYYSGTPAEQALLRRFSYSDRVRYYWHYADISAAVDRLLANLSAVSIPQSLLSLYLPAQYDRLRAGDLAADPTSLIVDKVRDVLRVYASAC